LRPPTSRFSTFATSPRQYFTEIPNARFERFISALIIDPANCENAMKPVFLIIRPAQALDPKSCFAHHRRLPRRTRPYLLVVLSITIVFSSCTLVALCSCVPGLGRGILKLPAALGLADASRACNNPSLLRGILESVACLRGSNVGCRGVTPASGVV
jgi:hypothetical protein